MPYRGPTLMDLLTQGIGRATASRGAPTMEQLEQGEAFGMGQKLGYPQQAALMQQLYADREMNPITQVGGQGGFMDKRTGGWGMISPGQRAIQGEIKMQPDTERYEEVGGYPAVPPSITRFDPMRESLNRAWEQGGSYTEDSEGKRSVKINTPEVDVGARPPGFQQTPGSWENEPGAGKPISTQTTSTPTAQPSGGGGYLDGAGDLLKGAGNALSSVWNKLPDIAPKEFSRQTDIGTNIEDKVASGFGQAVVDASKQLIPVAKEAQKIQETVAEEGADVVSDLAKIIQLASDLPTTMAAALVEEYITKNAKAIATLSDAAQTTIAGMLKMSIDELKSYLMEAGEESVEAPVQAPVPRLPLAPEGSLDGIRKLMQGLGVGPNLPMMNPAGGLRSAADAIIGPPRAAPSLQQQEANRAAFWKKATGRDPSTDIR